MPLSFLLNCKCLIQTFLLVSRILNRISLHIFPHHYHLTNKHRKVSVLSFFWLSFYIFKFIFILHVNGTCVLQGIYRGQKKIYRN